MQPRPWGPARRTPVVQWRAPGDGQVVMVSGAWAAEGPVRRETAGWSMDGSRGLWGPYPPTLASDEEESMEQASRLKLGHLDLNPTLRYRQGWGADSERHLPHREDTDHRDHVVLHTVGVGIRVMTRGKVSC